jgi:hypothetical protein
MRGEDWVYLEMDGCLSGEGWVFMQEFRRGYMREWTGFIQRRSLGLSE